jgi:hypothetical protein
MNRNIILAFACGAITVSAFAQSTTSPGSDTQPSVSAPDQQQLLAKAKQDFAAEKWSEAFREFDDLRISCRICTRYRKDRASHISHGTHSQGIA